MHIRAYFEISHGGNAINSLDFHPSGRKLVTGGHGTSGIAGEVKVWDVTGVYGSYGSKKDIGVLGTANFQCKFSLSGKDIGVADDGRTITILRLQSRTKNGEGKIIEIYRPAYTVMGHLLEVLHVEFSPTSIMLASTSIDGCCKIWNLKNWPQCLANLNEKNGGHREGEAIKGCSWDPMGKLLATQSSDRSLKIWKTFTWECLWTLTEPFLESSQSTMFLRMDWSPDGAMLIVPSTVNNSGPTAQIIMRKDWSFEKDLVGHRRPLACVAFCKDLKIFTDEKNRKHFGYVVALGGRDRTLSVWQIPKTRRPIVVIKEIVKLTIVDMKWFGRHLAISSLDGSVRFVIFKESEIGVSVSEHELKQHCVKIYGFGLPSQTLSPTTSDSQNAESEMDEADQWSKKISEIFAYERKEKPKLKLAVEKSAPTPPTPQSSAPPPTIQAAAPKSSEGPSMIVRTKLGKKRMMTTFLGGLDEEIDEPKIAKTSIEFPQRHASSTTTAAETDGTKVVAEKIVVDDERDVKNYLKNIKFDYEKKKPTNLIIDNDAAMEYYYDSYTKDKPLQVLPYFGINYYNDINSKHTITVTNEITHGIGKKVARIWNLKENINSQIDGHIIGCDVNRQFLIIVKENNEMEMIERETGKSKNICQLPETPKSIKLYGDYLIVLLMNQDFLMFNISSSSLPIGKICTGSLTAFKNQKGHLSIHNGQPLFITSNQTAFIGSIEKRKWIQAILPVQNSRFSKFPPWLFSTLPSSSAAILNQIIKRISTDSNYQTSSTKFIPPSDQFVRALTLPSEFQFYNFVNEALKLKESGTYQCKHFHQTKNECEICQIFYLLTKFSLNLEKNITTNKAIE
uniref:Protein HIRA n=1 Tax=Panagrolaimus sp. ES5 TaxID=591445 RepID=A0AC34F5T7_9BILA